MPAVESFPTAYKDYTYRIVGDPPCYWYSIYKEGSQSIDSAESYELAGTANNEARKAIDAMSAIVLPEPEPTPEPEIQKKRTRRTKNA